MTTRSRRRFERPALRGTRPAVLRSILTAGFALSLALFARSARADVSSWANASAGPSFIDEGTGNPPQGNGIGTGMQTQGALSLQAGLGSTPENALVGGGLFHLETHFTKGTDLGLLGRIATQGYVLGDWGGALDLGGYERFWGVGSYGGLGALVLGAPWGITLRGEAAIGTNDHRSFGVVLGVDFLRLTIFRTTGTDWFPNPYPAYRAER